MKIQIHTTDCRFTLLLPSALLFNRLGLSLLQKALKPRIDLSRLPKQELLFHLKRFRKRKLPLCEVWTQDGEHIRIVL